MYKLWRRELSKPTTPDFNTRKKQSAFSQTLATIIKIAKKKEEFYIRVLFAISGARPRSSTDASERDNSSLKVNELQSELESLTTEEDQVILSLKSHEQQPFFLSKTYLYTLFVRILEIYQYAKQRIILKLKGGDERLATHSWDKLYEDGKSALTDCYQNLVYFQNYNLIELVTLATRKQNLRIYSILPPKVRKVQVTLKPIIRMSSTELKKSHSIDVSKEKAAELISKKLAKKEKKKIMQTQKRLQQRKKLKPKPLTFKQLYGILGVKQIKIEEGYSFKKSLQIDALERNAVIIEERRKWQKKFDTRSSSMKLFRQKYD